MMKNKKYLQQKFSRKVLVPQTTVDSTSRVSKSYVPFTCKFPMVMHFVPIPHSRCRSKTNFYVYDKISLKFCASFRFFLAVLIEKFQKIHYLSIVRRGIDSPHQLCNQKDILNIYSFGNNLPYRYKRTYSHPFKKSLQKWLW